jgi:hypothetical protein
MKVLQEHDKNYDFVRAGLLFSMILYHAFGVCGLGQYFFFRATITLGFVLLSGFSIGALYTSRVQNDPQKYIPVLMRRGGKLLLIFYRAELHTLCRSAGTHDRFFRQGLCPLYDELALGGGSRKDRL